MTKEELTAAEKELLLEYLPGGEFDDAQLDELADIIADMIDTFRLDNGWKE